MVCESGASAGLPGTCGRWKKSLLPQLLCPGINNVGPGRVHAIFYPGDQLKGWKMAVPVRRHHIAVIHAPTMWSASVKAKPSRWKSIPCAVSVFSPTRFQKRHQKEKNRAGGEQAEEKQQVKFAAAVGGFFGGAVRGWEETVRALAAGLGFNTKPGSVFYLVSLDG